MNLHGAADLKAVLTGGGYIHPQFSAEVLGASVELVVMVTFVDLELGEFEMSKFVARFMKDESGATAIEYGLIACLISVAVIGVLTSIGSSLNGTFTDVNSALH